MFGFTVLALKHYYAQSEKQMNIIEELIALIKTKNSWGKNELLLALLDIMAKHRGES